jgi:hypothetical protein
MLDNKSGIVAFLWDQTSGFAETQMTNIGGNKFSTTLSGKTAGSIIKVACKFAYAGGMSVTKQLSYTVGSNCGASGIGKIVSNDTFFYPNPTKDLLYFKSTSAIRNITISNLLGQTLKVIVMKGSENNINISDLGLGNYLFTTKLENGITLVSRVVKN